MFHFNDRVMQVLCACLLLSLSALPLAAAKPTSSQSGVVLSGDQAVAFSLITIYQAGKQKRGARMLGRVRADVNGEFTVHYQTPPKDDAVLYLIADGEAVSAWQNGARTDRSPIRLATVLGQAPYPAHVVINERTTVATAYAMAQFIDGNRIGGVYPGLQNSAATVRNLVDLSTGDIGSVLGSTPNADETSALRTVNSLANMLSGCVRSIMNCAPLFELATPPGGSTPSNTLDAMVHIAHFPGQNVEELILAAQIQATYSPALPADAATNPNEFNFINSLVLAIRYNGDGPNGQMLDGPGNIAFDSHGNAWINNNYTFGVDPSEVVCGSTKVIKLTPTGGSAPGAPYGGDDIKQDGMGAGGLYGAGFGIALDPEENVWVSSFGFQGQVPLGSDEEGCPNDVASLAINVAQFNPDGQAISMDGNPSNNDAGGYQVAGMEQPQGIVSDRHGNIWVAGCIDGTVTRFNMGNPDDTQLIKPDNFDKAFDIAIDTRGHAWVTGNGSKNVIELNRQFKQVGEPVDGFDLPMGIASDSAGNLWVADAGLPNPPCPAILDPSDQIGVDGESNTNAAVSLIRHQGPHRQVTEFNKDGGKLDGLRWPWGIAVDGNDNVWVANFAGQTIMQLCGANPANCPPGRLTGDPISPDSGWFNNALRRVTAVQIDPSGNVWMTNNWLLEGFDFPENPGGHEIVVFIGLAAPVKTPSIGPPRRPGTGS